MPKPQLCALLFLHFLICGGISLSDLNSSELAGKISECAAGEESIRRALLMRRRYISYDTLRRDLVPCDRPGASYYNCKAAGVANSYSRGCEMITRCARGD